MINGIVAAVAAGRHSRAPKCNHEMKSADHAINAASSKGVLSVSVLLLFMAIGVGSCSYVAPVDPAAARSRIPFLIEGRTPKEEVLNRLGVPTNEYENGRIATYVMREDLNSRLQVGNTGFSRAWKSEVYNLVLVFGPTAILERYSLIRVQ